MMNALYPISRRNALGLMAAVSVPPTAAVAVAAAHSGDVPNALQELLDGHAAALAADNAAWDALADLDGLPELESRPRLRVEVAKVARRDEDGNQVLVPSYAYSEEAINKVIDQHLSAYCAMMPGEKCASQREKVAESINAKREAFLADFRNQQAERQRIEDEVGYTAARDRARATATTVKVLEQQIIAYVPATLSEAAMKAAWIVEAFHRDEPYIDTEEQLLEALAAIGRASV